MTGHTASHPELTKNQALVLAQLEKAEGPLSAYAILDQLRSKGFRAPPQVYRALDKLTTYGLVHRLESLNAFVACAHPHCQDHSTAAFAICENCGSVKEFADTDVLHGIATWARTESFRVHKTTVELKGVCGVCGGG